MRQHLALDLAAAHLEPRRQHWLAHGLAVSDTLWTENRDGLAVRLAGADWQVGLIIELHDSGWAYVHFVSETQAGRERRRVRSPDAWDALLDEAVVRASRISLQPARLLAGTCTTGWLDWIHGELWLLPDALIRVRSGLMDSMANSVGGSGVTARTPYQLLCYDAELILSTHRTNKVIPFTGIAHARLHGGVTTSGMTLHMTDGTRHKLLWMSNEPARRLLKDRLLPVLGSRLMC